MSSLVSVHGTMQGYTMLVHMYTNVACTQVCSALVISAINGANEAKAIVIGLKSCWFLLRFRIEDSVVLMNLRLMVW